MCVCVCVCVCVSIGWLVGRLVVFYGISIHIGYLKPNPVLDMIYKRIV